MDLPLLTTTMGKATVQKKVQLLHPARRAAMASLVAAAVVLVMPGCATESPGQAVAVTAGSDGIAAKTAPAARFNGTWNKAPGSLSYSRNPPFTPEAKTRFENLRPQDDPGARCTESGLARMMISPYPMQIVAFDNHLLIVHEFNHVVRRIWFDLEAHDEDPEPSFYGENVVHWEGDTMVVDTVGLNGLNYLDPTGNPQSDRMHVIERWRLTDPDTIEIEFTFDDPVYYTEPWKSVQTYKRSDWKLNEFSCNENNRNNPDDPSNPRNLTSTEDAQAYEQGNRLQRPTGEVK